MSLFETDQGINSKPIKRALNLSSKQTVSKSSSVVQFLRDNVFVFVRERERETGCINVCLLRKVATEKAVLPWDVEMSCFDMPCLPYKK